MGEENTPGGTKGLVAAIERFEQARDELKQATRDAHAATKDIKAAIAEFARLRGAIKADVARVAAEELQSVQESYRDSTSDELARLKASLIADVFGDVLGEAIDTRVDGRLESALASMLRGKAYSLVETAALPPNAPVRFLKVER